MLLFADERGCHIDWFVVQANIKKRLKRVTLNKEDKIWQQNLDACGYIYEGEQAPKMSVCNAPASEFELVGEDKPEKLLNSNTYIWVYTAVIVVIALLLSLRLLCSKLVKTTM